MNRRNKHNRNKKDNKSNTINSYNSILAKYNENKIPVLIQGFYGNRTVTLVAPEHFDEYMLGWLAHELFMESYNKGREKIDRTIVRLPGTENLVLVYNKYQEEEALNSLQKFIQELRMTDSRYNPTAVIPELGLVLYSRCIVCRMNENGELSGIEAGDTEKAVKYLAQ